MTTTIITITVIAVLAYLVLPRKKFVTSGKFIDLAKQFNLLLNSKPSFTSLTITIKGKEDFIQFSKNGRKIEMDFPLVTENQINNGIKYREICSDLGIEVRETAGSDGSLFLDADLSSNDEVLAETTKKILNSVFGATDETKLKYSFFV